MAASQGGREWFTREATVDDVEVVSELGAALFTQTFAADNAAADVEAYVRTAFASNVQARELTDPAYRSWLARAIRFYAKHGFAAVGRQTFQLGDGLQHDLVVARPLRSDRSRRRGAGAAEELSV